MPPELPEAQTRLLVKQEPGFFLPATTIKGTMTVGMTARTPIFFAAIALAVVASPAKSDVFQVIDDTQSVRLSGDAKPEPSFDCRRARAADEREICANPELSALDREIAWTYSSLRRCLPSAEKTVAQREQQEWIATRKTFRDSEDLCNKEKSRLAQLRQSAIERCARLDRDPAWPSRQRYTNTLFGFEITVSSGLRRLRESGEYALALKSLWGAEKGTGAYDGIDVVAFAPVGPDGQTMPGLELRVGVRRGDDYATACRVGRSDEERGEAKVGGTAFRVYTLDDAGMGKQIRGERLETFHRPYCYVIETFETSGVSLEGADPVQLRQMEKQRTSAYAVLKAAGRSLRFVKPELE